jgi:hypothetical protein
LVEVPFQFREGLIWLRVDVPDSAEKLNFLLDSGASASVIGLRTAQRLGLRLGKKVCVRGVRTTTSGYWPTRLRAGIGGVSLPKDSLALDLQSLSDACDLAVDGLVGVDFFRDRVVQVDFAAGKIRLFKPARATFPGDVLPLRIRPCGMCLPVSVNGAPAQWLRLDTGCAAALQWVSPAARDEKGERRIAVGLDTVFIPQATTRLRIGPRDFDAVPTGVHRREIFAGESGLLGTGILARFSLVTIDMTAGRVVLGEVVPAN